MIEHRFTIVAEGQLPDHLLPDIEHALAHIGWLGLRGIRRRPHPALSSVAVLNDDTPPASSPRPELDVIDYLGRVAPLISVPDAHDHDAMFTTLIKSLRSLGLACVHVAGAACAAAPDLIVLDLDSTLINEESLDLLAELAEVGRQIADLPAPPMNSAQDFESVLRTRVTQLAGQPANLLTVTSEQLTLTPGAAILINAARERNARLAISSQSFQQICGPLLTRLGITDVSANSLEIVNGYLTGEISGQFLGPEANAAQLQRWANQCATARPYTVAIGTGVNDIAMLRAATLGIAFAAPPTVCAAADVVVPMRRLDAVAVLLGLR